MHSEWSCCHWCLVTLCAIWIIWLRREDWAWAIFYVCCFIGREANGRKKGKYLFFSSQSRFVCSIVIVWDVVKLQFIDGYGSEECCVKQSRLIVICIIVWEFVCVFNVKIILHIGSYMLIFLSFDGERLGWFFKLSNAGLLCQFLKLSFDSSSAVLNMKVWESSIFFLVIFFWKFKIIYISFSGEFRSIESYLQNFWKFMKKESH